MPPTRSSDWRWAVVLLSRFHNESCGRSQNWKTYLCSADHASARAARDSMEDNMRQLATISYRPTNNMAHRLVVLPYRPPNVFLHDWLQMDWYLISLYDREEKTL